MIVGIETETGMCTEEVTDDDQGHQDTVALDRFDVKWK